jgi:hypothetical protein
MASQPLDEEKDREYGPFCVGMSSTKVKHLTLQKLSGKRKYKSFKAIHQTSCGGAHLLEKLRQEDCLSLGVQDQSEHNSETLSPKSKQTKTVHKILVLTHNFFCCNGLGK